MKNADRKTQAAEAAEVAAQTAGTQVETIRERIVREEREAAERRVAEIRAQREADERTASELAAEMEREQAEAKARAEAEERRRAEEAAEAERQRRARNAAKRESEVERLERQYVLFERAQIVLDELIEAEGKGLNSGVTYRDAAERLAHSVVYNRDYAKNALLNLPSHFRRLGIAD